MKALRIHPDDNVAVAVADISAGETVSAGGVTVIAAEGIPRGHKLALTDIVCGGGIVKYGCVTGKAARPIRAGEWVHVHNMKTALTESAEYEYKEYTESAPAARGLTFDGYMRPDGRAAVRNEIWIIPTVGCVNSVAERLAREGQRFVGGSVEGIFPLTHPLGCSQLGGDHERTKKLLAALARHPNAGGVLVVGLGCENLTMAEFSRELGEYDPGRVRFLVCQDDEDEIAVGARLLYELAEHAGKAERRKIGADKLVVGLKCGGSDGLSGITANPLVGRFTDILTGEGGSAILTEVPEMFGAEGILFRRAESREVFDRAVGVTEEFRRYYTSHGMPVYENPSPGNKTGGITTLEEKSCGCVGKGGHVAVADVLGYGDTVRQKGLSLLSAPGNDIVSSTALAAAGAHMILFTTGRGTPFGAPVPTVKISSNTELAEKKRRWIDFDAGRLLDGEDAGVLTDELLKLVLRVAGGEKTKNEQNGDRGIAIWHDGVTL